VGHGPDSILHDHLFVVKQEEVHNVTYLNV
jgi:hypothetical protein